MVRQPAERFDLNFHFNLRDILKGEWLLWKYEISYWLGLDDYDLLMGILKWDDIIFIDMKASKIPEYLNTPEKRIIVEED